MIFFYCERPNQLSKAKPKMAQCKGIWIPESRTLWPVESGIRENFGRCIWNPRPWNPEYGSKFQNTANCPLPCTTVEI